MEKNLLAMRVWIIWTEYEVGRHEDVIITATLRTYTWRYKCNIFRTKNIMIFTLVFIHKQYFKIKYNI